MLPGFRFVLAAILLSFSILVFGLGAAALLRSAHEQFASIPARQPPPEQIFVQQNDVPLTLALLRVDLAPQESAPTEISAPIAAPTEIANPTASAPLVETSDEMAPASERKAVVAAAEPVVQETQTAPAAQPEAQLAAVTNPQSNPQIENETLVPADRTLVEPAAASVAHEPAISPLPTTTKPEIKVATLGSPATALTQPKSAKAASAKADKNAIKKRARAQREKARRRAALLRARQVAARQKAAAQQPAANPFGIAAAQPAAVQPAAVQPRPAH